MNDLKNKAVDIIKEIIKKEIFEDKLFQYASKHIREKGDKEPYCNQILFVNLWKKLGKDKVDAKPYSTIKEKEKIWDIIIKNKDMEILIELKGGPWNFHENSLKQDINKLAKDIYKIEGKEKYGFLLLISYKNKDEKCKELYEKISKIKENGKVRIANQIFEKKWLLETDEVYATLLELFRPDLTQMKKLIGKYKTKENDISRNHDKYLTEIIEKCQS